MSPTIRPRGPLPSRVYWTRRILVLGVPLLLVVVIARVLSGSADGRDDPAATASQVSAETTPAPTEEAAPEGEPTEPTPLGPAAPGADGKGKGKKGKKDVPPEPVLAAPSGPCTADDIVALATIVQAPGGSDVPITFNLRTRETEACTWQVSPESFTVTITSGDDDIWSTRECPMAIPVQDVVVRREIDTPVTVVWSARRSDETCSRLTEWALPGWYHVQAAALAGEPTDVQFELVRPTSAVITKTVTPKPEKRNKKQQGDETSHVAGDDGGGNSEG